MSSLTAANVSVVESGRCRPPRGSRRPARPPCQPAVYWPRAVSRPMSRGERDGGEHLLLLGAQVAGVERDRLLHRGQREQLEQVVLDDVAGGADAVVVAGAAADADVLGHGDLHVVDVVGVPDRLEHLVGEAQRQDVLDRLLAQVVVDPEHRVGREDRRRRWSLSSRALARSWPNGFSMTTRRQASPRASARPERFSCSQTSGERAGRDRQVEREVAAGAALVSRACTVSASWSKAAASSKGPARTGTPRRGCARRPRRNGVRAWC